MKKAIVLIEATLEYLSKLEVNNVTMLKKTKKVEHIDLFWTANIVDLVELVFALQEANVLNKGTLHTKKLMSMLCTMFNLEMSDCFVHYMNIRGRSGSRTKFLDSLKKFLEMKMDSDEENIHRRNQGHKK